MPVAERPTPVLIPTRCQALEAPEIRMSQPDQPKNKVFLRLPDGYFSLTEEEQLAWAEQAALHICGQLRPTAAETERLPDRPGRSMIRTLGRAAMA